jgi:hypothetical protein
VTLLAGFLLAVPHGLYDALLICGMPGLAGLMMLTLVWLVLFASDPDLFEPAADGVSAEIPRKIGYEPSV